MTWTLVGVAGASGSSTSGTLTLATGQSSTASNLLVLALANASSDSAPTVPAGWTLVESSTFSTAPKAGAWIYAYFNNPGSITSAAVTFSTGLMWGQIAEWTCPLVAQADDADQVGAATGATTSTLFNLATSGNLATNNELAVAVVSAHYSSATSTVFSAGGSFGHQRTLNNGSAATGHAVIDNLTDTGSSAGATLSDNESNSVPGAGNWAGVIATFDQPGTSLTLPAAQVTVAAPVPPVSVPGSSALTAVRVAVAPGPAPTVITYLPPVMAVTVAARTPVASVPASVALTNAQAVIGSPLAAPFGPQGQVLPSAVAPSPVAFPSIIKCTGQTLTDDNGTVLPVMRGFAVPVFKVASPPFSFAHYQDMYTKGARILRIMVYWDELEPNQGAIDTNWLQTNLDVSIQRALTSGPGGNTGMYVWLGFYFGPNGIHMPAWAQTTTGKPASCQSNYITNGKLATQTLAQRYGSASGVLGSGWAGSPYGTNGYKGVIGMGQNEPTPDDQTGAGWLVRHVNQQAQMAAWMRVSAPQWIFSLSAAFGSGAMFANAPGSGHPAVSNQTFTTPPAVPTAFVDGTAVHNFWCDHHNYAWVVGVGTNSTDKNPDYDGRDANGNSTETRQRQDYPSYPPLLADGATPTKAQLLRFNIAYLASHRAYCAPSYANCPLFIGEYGWNPTINTDAGIAQNVADKVAGWNASTPPIVGVTQWDYAENQSTDQMSARPGAGKPGVTDPNGWLIWTNDWFANATTSVPLPSVDNAVTAQAPTIAVPATTLTLVSGAVRVAARVWSSMGISITLAPAQARAAARVLLPSQGNRTPLSLGGTEVDKNLLGGSALVTPPHTYSGTATLPAYAGTLVRLSYAGTLTGWTMITVNLTLAEFNDEQLAVAITSGGSALNITGMEVDAFFKTAAGVPDTDPSTIKLSSPSSGVTITNAAGGLATVTVPASDLASTGITFWRLDVLNAGLRNTVMFGAVSVTPM